MIGEVAVSTAGHDAGRLYIIIEQREDLLFLADGIKNKLVNPKRKNRKHVFLLKEKLTPETNRAVLEKSRGCDEMIRQTLHHLKKKYPQYK